MTSVQQRQARQTDGQTTYDGITRLCMARVKIDHRRN